MRPPISLRGSDRKVPNLVRKVKWGLVVLVATATIGGGVARAATCTWQATATGQNFNTSTANWSCGHVPLSTDDMVFDGGSSSQSCGLTSTITVNSVTFQNGYAKTVTSSFSGLTVTNGWTMSSGIFVGAGGTITIGTSLSVSGTASFTAATGVTQVGGNFSNTATFNANGGNVKLASTSTAATLKSGGASFAALTVTGSGTYTLQDALTTTGTVSVSAGTLTAGSRAVSIGGGLTINGGTFNASSGTTQVGGAFNSSGGTFNANGGTVTLTGTGALTAGASSFNALTINASGTYTLGSGLLVGANLTITAGTLAAGALAISVGGNWSNSGTFTTTGTTTLGGTSSSGTIKSGGSSFAALTINGSGGTYTLQDALATTSNLTLTAGTLAAGSFNVTVGGSFNVTSGAFVGGAGTVGITTNLALTGGTYTGGAGSATVGGNVSVTNTVTNGADPTLVGYWPLDDTASPAVDSSGNGNSLTWNGTPTTTTVVPTAITFTDPRALAMTGGQYAGSAVLSGVPELTPATVTLSAWYKATSVDTSGSEIISGSNTYGLRITTTGLTVMKRISDNTSNNDWIEYRVPEANVLDGKWHQIVGVILTGTGGGMSAYFDGVVAAGSYYVNGSASGNPKLLSASTTPTAATAASAAIDWDANTETFGLIVGNNPSTSGYNFGAGTGCSGTVCAIDDVRIYNRALTAAEVVALAHGNQPGTTAGIVSLAGSLTVNGTVTVQATGTLTLGSGSTLALGTSSVAGALTVDGTLNSTGGTIKAVALAYAFKVGSTAAAAPELNINGLTVKNTDLNGMWINANAGAVTTFTEFDKIAFSSGTGTQLLKVNAATLYLSSNGCTFDGSTTVAIALTSSATGSATGPRLMFGNATCATNDATTGLCATTEKTDNDSNNDGIPSPTTGGVVQFIRAAEGDTDGTLVGFPTAAFDWNSFTYYSTYVAFHDASGGSDVIYVRDESGNPLYSWTDPIADETITGTPQWTTTTGGTHYLYVSVNAGSINNGKVYRLIDTGTKTTSGTLTVDATWPTATPGAYQCGCTITSDLSLDATNVYWAATTASAQVLMGLAQVGGGNISSGWPVPTPVNVTTSSPTLSISGTTTLYLGVTGDLLQLALTGTTFVANSAPGTVTGRVSFGTSALAATKGTSRVYAGDSSGTLWAISPSNFTGTNSLWSYAAGSAITNNYYDAATDTVAFGTSGGKVVVLNATDGSLLKTHLSPLPVTTDYPFTLNTSDPITAAPLYVNGVLAVGTTLGKLYLLDRNTGLTSPGGVSILQEYSFGPAESVSTIAYDANLSRYMVSTSSAANDGRIYYFDAVTDPTPTFQ